MTVSFLEEEEKVAKNNRKKNNFKRGNKIELAKVSTLTNHKNST